MILLAGTQSLRKLLISHQWHLWQVDLQQILCQGTPATVADEVRRLMDILGQDGGYVVGPGHTYIQVDAPIANILSMYKTAHEHRLY